MPIFRSKAPVVTPKSATRTSGSFDLPEVSRRREEVLLGVIDELVAQRLEFGARLAAAEDRVVELEAKVTEAVTLGIRVMGDGTRAESEASLLAGLVLGDVNDELEGSD